MIDDRDSVINSGHRRPRRFHRGWLPLRYLLLLALVLWLAQRFLASLDPFARQQAERAAVRAAVQADRLQWADDALYIGLRLLPLAFLSATGAVGLLLVYRRWATVMSIRAHYVVAAIKAQQPLPDGLHTLTYSPHYAPHIHPHRVESDAPENQPALSDGAVPTFAQLLDAGTVGRGSPLLLGYDAATGRELVGSWLDLYSTAVSGMPGSGKTTSQRFLACQTALHGAQFAVCDPHAGAAEDSLAATLAPLEAAFVCQPGASDQAILEIVRYVADVGRRRVAGSDRSTTPLILWVDELTSLLGRSSIAEELGALLERVAQEYRKRAVFVCASGQIWTAARTTSELRDSFASVLCHRMKRAQARLLLPTDEAEQVERLPTGRAVLWRTSGATTVVQIPQTTAQDVARVATLLADGRLPEPPSENSNVAGFAATPKPAGSPFVAGPVRLPGAPVSAEAARAAQLFLDGHDPAQIVWELRGVKSSQGGKYQAALSEVLGLIRAGLRRYPTV